MDEGLFGRFLSNHQFCLMSRKGFLFIMSNVHIIMFDVRLLLSRRIGLRRDLRRRIFLSYVSAFLCLFSRTKTSFQGGSNVRTRVLGAKS